MSVVCPAKICSTCRTLRHSLFGPGTLDPFVSCFNLSSSWLKSSILCAIYDICLVFSTEKLICYQVINKFILSLPVDLISKLWREKKWEFDCLRLKWLKTFKLQVSLWEILWKKIYVSYYSVEDCTTQLWNIVHFGC